MHVITADTLHTQREHGDWPVGVKHAAYCSSSKGNQPILHPGHHRARPGLPHATQAIRITRRVRPLTDRLAD